MSRRDSDIPPPPTDAERFADLDWQPFQGVQGGDRYPVSEALYNWQWLNVKSNRLCVTPVRVYLINDGTYALHKSDMQPIKDNG